MRYPDAGSFRDALLAIARPAGPDGGTHMAAPRSRKLLAGIAITAALVVAAVVIVFAFWSREPKGDRQLAMRHNQRAQEHEDAGRISEAEIEYGKAVIADRRWEVPLNNLAMIAMSKGNLTEADSLLGLAVAVKAGLRRRALQSRNGPMDSAAIRPAPRSSTGRRSAPTPPFSRPTTTSVRSSSDGGEPLEAAAILDCALAKERIKPSPVPELRGYLLKNRGVAASRLGRREEAAAYWSKALEIIPRNAELQELLQSNK